MIYGLDFRSQFTGDLRARFMGTIYVRNLRARFTGTRFTSTIYEHDLRVEKLRARFTGGIYEHDLWVEKLLAQFMGTIYQHDLRAEFTGTIYGRKLRAQFTNTIYVIKFYSTIFLHDKQYYSSLWFLIKENHDLRHRRACTVSGTSELRFLVTVLPAIENNCSHGTLDAGIAK